MRLPTKGIAAVLFAAIAACGGKTDTPTQAGPVRVASIVMTTTSLSLKAGASQLAGAVAMGDDGKAIAGKAMTWSTSNAVIATVATEFNGGRITAVSAGSATITAEVEGKTATVAVTVTALPECNAATAVPMNVGDVRTLTSAEKEMLCVSGADAGAEYKMVVVNTSTTNTTSVTLEGTNTKAIAPLALTQSIIANPYATQFAAYTSVNEFEERSDVRFMERENEMLQREFPNGIPKSTARQALRLAEIPREGDIVEFKLNFAVGGTCSTNPPVASTVVKRVGKNVILYADQNWTDQMYTDGEFAALAASLDTLVYPLDTLNYGVPSDIDGNGRINIVFSPTVYDAGLYGVVASGDFLYKNDCPRSNQGEMTYLATPKTGSAGRTATRESMLAFTPYLFAHELQHIINRSIRGTGSSETSALNEGLSYLAIELLFYKAAGLTPGMNLPSRFAAQDANDAFRWSSELFSFYFSFASNTAANTPFATAASTPTFGALWYLMRFGADRRGGDQAALWRSMVNTTSSGVGNLAKLGNVPALLRDWAVSQVVDDVVPGIAAAYQFPSWNYRSFVVNPAWPLTERALVDAPSTVSLINGGTSFYQFRVDGGTYATIRANTNGAVPTADLMLVRSK